MCMFNIEHTILCNHRYFEVIKIPRYKVDGIKLLLPHNYPITTPTTTTTTTPTTTPTTTT